MTRHHQWPCRGSACVELLELQPKARVEGDVSYKALEMHQGRHHHWSIATDVAGNRDKPAEASNMTASKG
jgi:cytoskeletal protein CcmA (bactofilin family)